MDTDQGIFWFRSIFFLMDKQSNGQQQPTVKVHNKKNEEDFLEALEHTDTVNQKGTDGVGVDYRI